MSCPAYMALLIACAAISGFSTGILYARAADRRTGSARPSPRPVSTLAAQRVALDYLRKIFPDFAAKSLVVESWLVQPASHPRGEEVSVSFYEVLAANGALSGNYIALRVKRGRQVFLDRERHEPVPPEASAKPAIPSSRAAAAAVAAVGSPKTHVASRAKLVWVARHGKPVNRLAWRVPVAPRGGGHLTAEVAVDAQNGAVIAISKYR